MTPTSVTPQPTEFCGYWLYLHRLWTTDELSDRFTYGDDGWYWK